MFGESFFWMFIYLAAIRIVWCVLSVFGKGFFLTLHFICDHLGISIFAFLQTRIISITNPSNIVPFLFHVRAQKINPLL